MLADLKSSFVCSNPVLLWTNGLFELRVFVGDVVFSDLLDKYYPKLS